MTKKKIARSKRGTKGAARTAGKGGEPIAFVPTGKPGEVPVDDEIARAAERAGIGGRTEPKDELAAALVAAFDLAQTTRDCLWNGEKGAEPVEILKSALRAAQDDALLVSVATRFEGEFVIDATRRNVIQHIDLALAVYDFVSKHGPAIDRLNASLGGAS